MKGRFRDKSYFRLTIVLTFIILFFGIIYISHNNIEEETTHAIGNIIETDEKNLKNEEDTVIKEEEEVKGVQVEEQEISEEDSIIREKFQKGKVAYLTFDDGPSIHVTPMILDILEEKEIAATFFVIGSMAENNPHVLNRIYENDHVIGNHTYSHKYAYIYESTDNFGEDILRWEDTISSILGQDFNADIFRFPGGSFEHDKEYFEVANNLGYEIYDWNVVTGDGVKDNSPKDVLINQFVETSYSKGNLIILMHDTDAKLTTAESLGEIIDYLIEQGYVFDTLNYFNKR